MEKKINTNCVNGKKASLSMKERKTVQNVQRTE